MIESLEKNPANGGIPTSASEPTRKASLVCGIDGSNLLLAQGFEFVRGKRRVPQDFRGQFEYFRKIVSHGLDRDRHTRGSAEYIHSRFQFIELVLDLLARVPVRSPHEHGAGKAADSRVANQVFLIAELQPEVRLDNVASSSLGNHRQLEPAGQIDALRTLVDIFG